MSSEPSKLLDAWMAPPESGAPVGCITTSFTFEPGFFDEECLARFLGLDAALITGGDETDTVVYVLEREERLADVRASVLIDRTHAKAAASFRWDVIPVTAGRGGVQHSKVSLLLWERRMRLIVASANLTRPGYRSNIEVFTVLDDPDLAVPTAVFSGAVAFLRAVIDRHTLGASGEKSPRGRAQDTLKRAHQHLQRRDSRPKRGDPAIAFFHTLGATDLLEQAFDETWQGQSPPTGYVASSPYFDRDDATGVEALSSRLSRRGQVRGQLAVVTREAGTEQTKVDAPELLMGLQFRGAPELRAWPQDEAESRVLHAKAYCYFNDNQVMLVSGSANATSAGLGLGQVRNIEAVLAVSDRGGGEVARELKSVVPKLTSLPDGTRVFDAPVPEEQERLPVLPSGFLEALYHPDQDTVVIALDPGRLPKNWLIRRGPETWATSEDRRVESSESSRTLEGSLAPKSLTVEWDSADGTERLMAELVVAVADAGSLPDPPEIESLTLAELLDLLAIGGRLHDLLRRLVARRMSESSDLESVSAELDPHKRVDTSKFMLQRTRKVAYALEGLRRKLNDPIANGDALTRRLRGPFGATGLRDAADRAVEEGSMGDRERAFLLAELALVVSRVKWQPLAGAISLRRCREEGRAVIAELRPGLCGDDALDAYVESAFEAASR